MEIHPGKQTFIDDFFSESMLGTQRVLNPSEKLTVENSIHIVLPEIPWERDEATGPIIYDENQQILHLYYQGAKGRNLFARVPGRHRDRPQRMVGAM